jgi:2-polyprenyl-6-methoxyphenol hydroxylase-like FAD-dependent oxidoreductase
LSGKDNDVQHQSIKHALIIGGGIGGLAAAIALRRAGIQATVYERADEIRAVGAGLALWANAVRALGRLGLGDAVRAIGVPEASGAVHSWRGETLIPMSSRDLEHKLGEISIVVHRAELQAILQGALDDDAVRLGARCTGFTQSRDGVTAQFADGTTASGDLLIGADGLHSAVRAQLFGARPPRYAGYTAWRAIAPFDHARLTPGETMGRGARFGMAPVGGGQAYWYATFNTPEGGRDSEGQRKPTLLELFRGWHSPIEALIEATDEAAILRNDIYDRDPLPYWSVGRVTLLGDAAHPMTPNLGQGACQALEDAVVLADVLKEGGDVVAALRAYQSRRIERTAALVRQARQVGAVGQWSNPLACRLRDALMKYVVVRVQDRQMERIAGYVV